MSHTYCTIEAGSLKYIERLELLRCCLQILGKEVIYEVMMSRKSLLREGLLGVTFEFSMRHGVWYYS